MKQAVTFNRPREHFLYRDIIENSSVLMCEEFVATARRQRSVMTDCAVFDSFYLASEMPRKILLDHLCLVGESGRIQTSLRHEFFILVDTHAGLFPRRTCSARVETRVWANRTREKEVLSTSFRLIPSHFSRLNLISFASLGTHSFHSLAFVSNRLRTERII